MTVFGWTLFKRSLYRITFLTHLCRFTVMSHLKHLPQNWQSPIKVVAVVAGREITHELMRCCCGCPWCSGLWCLSEVSAGLLPEPAWSFMASLHTDWCMVSSSAAHLVGSVLMTRPSVISCSLWLCCTCHWEHPYWPSGDLAHLEPSASFMACWPVDFIVFYCTVWRSY